MNYESVVLCKTNRKNFEWSFYDEVWTSRNDHNFAWNIKIHKSWIYLKFCSVAKNSESYRLMSWISWTIEGVYEVCGNKYEWVAGIWIFFIKRWKNMKLWIFLKMLKWSQEALEELKMLICGSCMKVEVCWSYWTTKKWRNKNNKNKYAEY